jgi:LPS-assembly protein
MLHKMKYRYKYISDMHAIKIKSSSSISRLELEGAPHGGAPPGVPGRFRTYGPGAHRFRLFVLLLIVSLFRPLPASAGPAPAAESVQVRNEIPYRDGTVILTSDFQEKDLSEGIWRASGNVKIHYQDILITTDEAVYNERTGEGHTTGTTHFSQGDQWLTCSRAEFNFDNQTGTFYDAKGFTDREFLVTGRTIIKTGRDTYRVLTGTVTACKGDNPKWRFTASRSEIRLDHTAHLYNTFLKVKGLPVFYTPYTILPLEKKTRSSGFTMFQTGTSTSKGRVFSQGYYQTLGRSADASLLGDYFSLRGLALGGRLRTRPNASTFFNIDIYGIRDKLHQGGVRLVVDGRSQLSEDWRAVERVNITSSFEFRQAFSDSFKTATVAQEHANVFLTGNSGNFSTNISFERQEVVFPIQPVVIWKLPSLEFVARDTQVGKTPFVFSFQSSIGGLSRRNAGLDTENFVQRLDVSPRLSLRLPPLAGFSIVPSVGVRETYYGAQFSDSSETGVLHQGMHRRYAELSIDLKTPYLEKYYDSSRLGTFLHRIEPYATYRWIHGIENPERIIRFDENDAVADTSEFEYGLVNRFYTNRKNGAGIGEKREIITIAVAQKYYFDPSFGDAFQPGELNSFYPLDTLSGFYQTGVARRFSPLSATVRIRVRDRLHQDFQADYDTKLQRWRNASLSTVLNQNKFSLSGTYLRMMQTEPYLLTGNQLQASLGYGKLTRGFSSLLTVSYNFQSSTLLNSQTRLGYAWDCCSVLTEFKQFSLGLRTESEFSISFGLKGIGSVGNLQTENSLF